MEKMQLSAIIRPNIPKKILTDEFKAKLIDSGFNISEKDGDYVACTRNATNLEELAEYIAAMMEQALQAEDEGQTRYYVIECSPMCQELHHDCFENYAYFISADRVQKLSTRQWLEEKSKELENDSEVEFF